VGTVFGDVPLQVRQRLWYRERGGGCTSMRHGTEPQRDRSAEQRIKDLVETPHYIDCCHGPELRALRTLYESAHDMESLQQCASCGTYWFHRFHEYVNWSTGGDDLTSWFTALTDEEGAKLRNVTDGHGEDLSFLTTRPSWRDDRDGAQRVDGAPDRPWS
jgi:hypothetical protein